MTGRILKDRDFYEKQMTYSCSARLPPATRLRQMLNHFATDRFDIAADLLGGGDSLLDVACDGGALLRKAELRFGRTCGVDIAPSRLSVARRTSEGEPWAKTRPAHLVCANANDGLPFADASFTCVSAFAILEHVFDVYGFLRDLHRILVPEGILVLEVPNIGYVKHRVRLLFGRLPVTSSPYGWAEGFGWDGGHLHYFTVGALRDLLADTGFDVERTVSSGGTFAKLRNVAVSLLAGNIAVRARKRRDIR